MKKYIFVILSVYYSLILSMEQQIKPCEWNASAYDKGCKIQTDAFFEIFNKYNIPINNKTILDVGCGTCRIATKLAEKALHVHCIDASKNMIDFAQNNKPTHITNMSFEQSFAETFKSKKTYQLGIMSFCLHWFNDQNAALVQMYKNLENDSLLFTTSHTKNTPEPTSIAASRKTIEFIDNIYQCFNGKSLIQLSGSAYPCDEELDNMFKNAGFTIIKREQQSFKCEMTKEQIKDTQWPIISSRPIMQWIPTILIDYFFNLYMENYLALTEKTKNGNFIEKFTTTVVYARKVKT